MPDKLALQTAWLKRALGWSGTFRRSKPYRNDWARKFVSVQPSRHRLIGCHRPPPLEDICGTGAPVGAFAALRQTGADSE